MRWCSGTGRWSAQGARKNGAVLGGPRSTKVSAVDGQKSTSWSGRGCGVLQTDTDVRGQRQGRLCCGKTEAAAEGVQQAVCRAACESKQPGSGRLQNSVGVWQWASKGTGSAGARVLRCISKSTVAVLCAVLCWYKLRHLPGAALPLGRGRHGMESGARVSHRQCRKGAGIVRQQRWAPAQVPAGVASPKF